MTGERERLEQERDQALRDLVDLERQVDEGEIPPEVAAELRAGYERTAATALAQLAEATPAGEGPDPATERPSSRARWATYALALAVAAFAAVVLLPTYLGERTPGGAVTGNEVFGSAGAPGGQAAAPRDLSTVTDEEMEQVIAENPEVVGMRLALAHRYLDGGDQLAAARHYLVALDQEPRNVEALAHYGWLLLQVDDPQPALEYVDRALQQDPRNQEALWFKANITLFGLSDPGATLTVLDRLRQLPDLAPEVRAQVDALAAEATAQGGAG